MQKYKYNDCASTLTRVRAVVTMIDCNLVNIFIAKDECQLRHFEYNGVFPGGFSAEFVVWKMFSM